MSTPELKQYIADELARGVSKDDLRTHLRTHGWQEADINLAFSDGSAPTTQPGVKKPGLFDPNTYPIMGFILGVVPLFIMSLWNSRRLPSGRIIASTTIKFIAATVVVWVLYIGLGIWAVIAYKDALVAALAAHPTEFLNAYFSMDKTAAIARLIGNEPVTVFAQAVVQNAGMIFFAINIAIMIFMVRFSNKHELPEYKQLRQEGLIKTKSPFIPFIIGIIFMAALYFGFPEILAMVVKNAILYK